LAEPIPPPPSALPIVPEPRTVQPPEGSPGHGKVGLTTPVRYSKGPTGPYLYGDHPAHVVDEDERAFKRNFMAGILAVAAGVCFVLGGVTGAGMWQELGDWVAPSLGELKGLVMQLFIVVATVAALGGILVISGGTALFMQRLFLGKLLVFIGGGTGLSGLVLSLGLPLWQGALSEFWTNLAGLASFSGAGTILAIASGFMTRLPFSLRKVLFGKG
jgi:hypothetical protein